MTRRSLGTLALLIPLFAACQKSSKEVAPDAGRSADGGSAIAGTALFARLAGLWSGQAGSTPLGSFPEVNMDFRAADSHWLFGRVDLDAANNLRYGFAIEDLDGQPTLIFRNGGYFQGVLRDTTTQLMDSDDDAGTYHFCASEPTCLYVNGTCIMEQGGCGFVDALFTFSAADQMVFNAHVMGQEHEIWTATRKETRTIPSPFPTDATPLSPDAGWPTMQQLSADVTWTTPLTKATDIWVVLSTTPCAEPGSVTFNCTPSRTLTTTADAGATSATLLFDQIHTGSYDAVALVDIAGGFATTLSPEPGDGVSNPSASVTVPDGGVGSATLPILLYLP